MKIIIVKSYARRRYMGTKLKNRLHIIIARVYIAKLWIFNIKCVLKWKAIK